MASDPEKAALLARIRELEEQNSLLQDKLDMIYSILAPDYENADFDPEEDPDSGLIQIESSDSPGTTRKNNP